VAANSRQTARPAAFIFIFITVALDMLALGVVIPVLPRLVLAFEGGNSASAATMVGLFATVFALMQFIFAPVLGVLSDRFGRRPVILLSNLGLGLDYLVMALAPSIGWLFLGRTISGIFGASFGLGSAYIADITPPEERAKRFGMLAAAFGLGFVLGPAFGGVLGERDPRLPFWVASALSLVNFLYGVFVLPESLPPERRSVFNWAKANPVAALSFLRSMPAVFGLASIAFLYNIAHEVLPTTFVLYADYRYQWSTQTVGLALASIGVFTILVQGGLIGPFVRKFGERASVLTGLGCGVLGFLAYGLAATPALFWIGMPLLCLMGLWGPAAQALMSRKVDASNQGRLQGSLASLQGVAFTLGPSIFTGAFAAGVRPGMPAWTAGAPFLVAAALMAVALVIAVRATRV
jgi:DHA1 family tetracycline resistance protein-like MFS transporter